MDGLPCGVAAFPTLAWGGPCSGGKGRGRGGEAMTVPLQAWILEDRQADAELIAVELKRAGFAPDWQRVETAHDLRLRLTPTLQVILADYSLPGFTALDALAILKESGLDIPFIIVSGSLGDDRAVECLKRGATDYILKDRMAR